MSEAFRLIEGALYTTLSGDSNLNTTLGVGGRVFDTQAPSGSAEPYVIFQITAGGDENDSPRRAVDVMVRVEAISSVQDTARKISSRIDALLHNQELTITGWSNYATQNNRPVNLVDTVAGKQWYRKGAFYRLRASING